MKRKKKFKNAFYNQLTQITKINDYVSKNITYFKIQKIVNWRKSHSERDINTNNDIQTKNWKIYADSLLEQNIIKNASQITIIIFLMHFLNSKLSFMFRHCRRHWIKKFDLNRQKKNRKSNSQLIKMLT